LSSDSASVHGMHKIDLSSSRILHVRNEYIIHHIAHEVKVCSRHLSGHGLTFYQCSPYPMCLMRNQRLQAGILV